MSTKPSALTDLAIRQIGYDPSSHRNGDFKRKIASIPAPKLGRGLSLDQDVVLQSVSSSGKSKSQESQQKAKMILQRRNINLEKIDPNSTKSREAFDLDGAKKTGQQFKKNVSDVFDVIKNRKSIEEEIFEGTFGNHNV